MNPILKWISGLVALVAVTAVASGQRQLLIIDEDDIRIVRSVTDTHYEYLVDGSTARQSFDDARTILAPSPAYVPGYIRILDGRLTDRETEDAIELNYTATLVANRGLKNVYLLVIVAGDAEDIQIFGRPVGELEKGVEQDVTFTINIPGDIVDVAIDAFFLTNGLEIQSGDDRFPRSSPYDRFRRDVVRGTPPDAAVQVMRSHQPAAVRDDFDNPISGRVTTRVRVDADGYVREAEVLESDDWRLAESVLRVLPLWQFKPRIEDGRPQPGTARLPFVF